MNCTPKANRLRWPAVLAFAWLAGGCNPASEHAERAPDEPIEVRTMPVERVREPAMIAVAGVVRPVRRAQMGTRQAGMVERVLVKAGDRVEAGQPILQVDARDLKAALSAARLQRQAAQAASDVAERNQGRFQRLFDQRLIAKARLEEAEVTAENARGRLERAEAELASARVNLDYATLRAPFDGIVAEVIAETGSFVAPGPPLVVFEDRDRLEVDAAIDQFGAVRLEAGQTLSLAVAGLDEPLEATVQALLPALREPGVGQRLRLLIDDPPAQLVPGMVAEVMVPAAASAHAIFSVPASALIQRGQLDGVFLVETGPDRVARARLRWIIVEPKSRNAEMVAILHGLSEHDRVVVGEVVGRLVDDQAIIPDRR